MASSNTDYFNHDLQPHADRRNTASTMQVMGESGVGAQWPFFFWTPQLGSLPGPLPRDWLCPAEAQSHYHQLVQVSADFSRPPALLADL